MMRRLNWWCGRQTCHMHGRIAVQISPFSEYVFQHNTSVDKYLYTPSFDLLKRRGGMLSQYVQRAQSNDQSYGEEGSEDHPTSGSEVAPVNKQLELMEKLSNMDMNQLHTALNVAISSENYSLAAKIRDVIRLASEAKGLPRKNEGDFASWEQLGILDWLSERAYDLGFMIPTEIQRRAAPFVVDGNDCIIECETGSGKTLSFLLPALSRLDYPPETYPEDLLGPQMIVVVPTRELGVQIVMLIFKLFGGSVNPGIPGEPSNLFRYKGPRGLKVRGLLLDHEVDLAINEGYLDRCNVLVGTPELIAEALNHDEELVKHCRVIAIDEVDACMESDSRKDITEKIMRSALVKTPDSIENGKYIQHQSVVLVGATLQEELIELIQSLGWLNDPVRISLGSKMQVPSGLKHRYLVVDDASKVPMISRQLRLDLKSSSPDKAPARVVLFADDEQQARRIADPLRTSLWGDHSISVLLPSGAEPIRSLHSFRDNQSSLLIATPEAARGLDLPGVSHIYNMSPPSNAADYLHRAGRAGRIGSSVPGVITTLVSPHGKESLLSICNTLAIELEEMPLPQILTSDQFIEGDEESLDQIKKDMEAAIGIVEEEDNSQEQ